MELYCIFLVLKRSFSTSMIVLVVVAQALTEEVQAMQVMQSLHVGGVPAAVFLVYLRLGND
jgi:hypothetical protein